MSVAHEVHYFPEDHVTPKTPAETAAEQAAVHAAQKAEYAKNMPGIERFYQKLTGVPDWPIISTFSPATMVAAASGTFALTVNGSGFHSASVINWNGADVTTAFVNDSQLTATVAKRTTAGDTPVYVHTGELRRSPTKQFPFTATAEDPEETPTQSWLKADIVSWLLTKGVDLDEPALSALSKDELLSLVQDILN